MKTIIILFLFFTGFYTKAESAVLQTEPVKVGNEKTGFISVNMGGEVIPGEDFKYYSSVWSMEYGGKISQKSSFAAGFKIVQDGAFLKFQYEYGFIENSRWIPGVDTALLIGFQRKGPEQDNFFVSRKLLSGGFELGPYLKVFISQSYAIVLRAGVTYDANTDETPDLANSRAYLHLGIRLYI